MNDDTDGYVDEATLIFTDDKPVTVRAPAVVGRARRDVVVGVEPDGQPVIERTRHPQVSHIAR